jgi:hypothetical protein
LDTSIVVVLDREQRLGLGASLDFLTSFGIGTFPEHHAQLENRIDLEVAGVVFAEGRSLRVSERAKHLKRFLRRKGHRTMVSSNRRPSSGAILRRRESSTRPLGTRAENIAERRAVVAEDGRWEHCFWHAETTPVLSGQKRLGRELCCEVLMEGFRGHT